MYHFVIEKLSMGLGGEELKQIGTKTAKFGATAAEQRVAISSTSSNLAGGVAPQLAGDKIIVFEPPRSDGALKPFIW